VRLLPPLVVSDAEIRDALARIRAAARTLSGATAPVGH
jgi:hypothetical protein